MTFRVVARDPDNLFDVWNHWKHVEGFQPENIHREPENNYTIILRREN